MAEKPKDKKPRNIKGAGERIVLQGVPVAPWDILRVVAKERGLKAKNLEEALRDKGIKALHDHLSIPEDGQVTVWVPIGIAKAETREEAILAVLGSEVPGEYRAPNLSAWLGGKRYKVPTQVALDVENLD